MMTTSLRTLLSLSRRLFIKETTQVILRSKKTWTLPVKNNYYVNNLNGLSFNNKNGDYEEPGSRLLIITSFGFLGIFSAGKDEEEAEPELIMTIKRSILLIQVKKKINKQKNFNLINVFKD